jgi:hypothetical protein
MAGSLRSALQSPTPVTALRQVISNVDSVIRNLSAADAAATVARLQALAYDATESMEVRRLADLRLADSVFVFPVPATSAVPDRIRLGKGQALSATTGSETTVPLVVLFVNGIYTSPADFAVDYSLFADQLLANREQLPHRAGTSVMLHGFYVPSISVFGGAVGAVSCVTEVLRLSHETSPDWATAAKEFTQCGDLSSSASDIATILTGAAPSGDAGPLALEVLNQLKQHYGVVIVAHSRGTLVSQEAFQIIAANAPKDMDATHCVGFISIASPLWAPGGWGTDLSWGTIAAGKHVSDLMIQITPGTPKAPTVPTDFTGSLDLGDPVGTHLQSAYELFAGLRIHNFAKYVSSAPISGNIQQAIASEAGTIQTKCVPAPAPTISTNASSVSIRSSLGTNPDPQVVSISNSGTGTLSGLAASIAYQSGQSSGWLSASLSGTTAPATITLSTAADGLAVGTYNATLSISSTAGGVTNSPLKVSVTLTVSAVPSTPTISLSPASLTFAATTGSSNPAAQTVSVANDGTGTLSGLSASVSYSAGPTGWLSASLNTSTAPATLTIAPSVSGLAAGTYSATVRVASSASGVSNSPQTVGVTLLVSSAASPPKISLSQSAVSFSATAGGSSPGSQSVQITNTGGGTLSGLSAGIAYAGGQATGWLSASLSSTTATSSLTLIPSIGQLTAGTYSATVSVASTSASVANSPQSVTVTLTVSAAAAVPTISLSSASASFSGVVGSANPSSQSVSVTNGGTGTLSGLSTTVSYQGGQSGGWLSASLSTSTAPATVTLSPTIGSLVAGTYNATVSVSSNTAGVSNSPQTIAVSLVLTAPAGPKIQLSASSLSFSTTRGATNLNNQLVDITNGGGGTLSGISFGASYTAGQPTGWLSLLLTNGASAPTSLSVVPTGYENFAVGTYNAAVSVASSASGVVNSPQSVGVTMTIAPSPSPQLVLSSSSLSFSASVGGAFPSPQTVSLTSSSSSSLQIQNVSVVYVQGGTGWLSTSSSSTQTPTTITIAPQPSATLPAGTYVAQIAIYAPGASPQNYVVTVTMQLTSK